MTAKEKVYALHDFDAENPDEVSFKAGETIIVVEKDDAYGDGWWQGTNPRGETGLFPFSYTTFDRDQAMNLESSIPTSDPTILTGATADASREANGKGVKATMDDIDNALARMQAGRDDASERTGDLSVGETDEGIDAEDDYEKRAKARAALAVNAAKNQEEAEEAERVEQARLKAQAMRIFEEEEERHRQLLLQKEEERKQAAAKGVLPTEDKNKEAPIPGVDMSDESDSEGSQGPEYDDIAPTHAPLFGTSSAPATAAIGAGALAAGVATGSAVAAKSGASSNDTALASNDVGKGQARPLSPIESEDAHAKRSAGGISPSAVPLPSSSTTIGNTPTQNGIFQQQQQQQQQPHQDRQTSDDRSLDSSRIPDSPAPGGRSNFTVPSVGTAPTSFAGTETPKSSNQFANTAQQSPAPSTVGSRLATGPGGDPHEWTVEQVVEWGRSKGWDEASVVSKFAEHEISGDVLMEMDVNILKEIEISAFGKRFQVANAIKDLKKSLATGGAEQSPMQWSAPVDSTSGILQQQQNRSVSQPIERPDSRTDFSGTNDSGLGAAITGLGVAGGAAAVAGASGQRNVSQSTAPGVLNSTSFNQSGVQADKNDLPRPNSGAIEPGSASHDSLGNSANSQLNKSSFSPDNSINYSNFNQQHASSPRKRESGGSSTKSPADRTSFFAGLAGQKNRKPAPRVQSGGNSSGSVPNSADAESAGKGTLSRFGLNRLKGGGQQQHSNEPSPNQDLRNKISLPTGSPTYDAMGDTARRHRLSQFGPATASIPGFSSNHQKQASVGSSGPAAGDAYPQSGEPRSPIGEAPEGAVMVRIRPVEFEGWMRKKGERYNSWKPRYMALKGSDLVLLRDPTAPKIKGYVNMKGYKVIADENTNPGKYGFKILHESEKPHYFSSDDPIVVREWMKALMKATIGRDTSLPVISSYNNATISLKEAQRMNPPPRPPSPTSRARAQRAAARANKDQLTAKDASVLMGLQSPQERQYGFIQQESMSTASVEIDTMIDMLDSQSKYSKETQRPNSPTVSNFSKHRKQNSIKKENMTNDWDPIISKQNVQIECERKLPYSRHRQIQQPAPLQLIDSSHSRSKSLPQIEKDEMSSSNVKNEKQFMIENLASTHEYQQQEIVQKQISRSLPPSPPSKPIYNNYTIQQQLEQSSISSTFGLADLPAPPPPSHSPEHDDRIRALNKKQKEGVEISQPPTPISKDLSDRQGSEQRRTASSVESYPTLSASSMPSGTISALPELQQSQKREKRKSLTFANNKRPHSSCGFPKEATIEPIEQLILQKDGTRRKRADSAATSSRYSPTNSAASPASSSSNHSAGFALNKEKTWLKRQMEKVKNRSPNSNGTNGIREEPEIQQNNNKNEKNSLEVKRPQSVEEDQIVFSAMAMSETNSFSIHSRLQSANSEPSEFQSRIYRNSQSDNENKELSQKLKRLFGGNSSKRLTSSKRYSDATLAIEQGIPARRRSRSMGESIGMNAGTMQKRVETNEFDLDSTTDSKFCKSGISQDDDKKGKRRDVKNSRKSRSVALSNDENQRPNKFIDQNALLGLYTGKDIKQAEKMAATLAAYASEPNLVTNKQPNQFLSAVGGDEEPNSAISSHIAVSPQSSKSSSGGGQGFSLPSWSKWRKDHLRQRQSDLIAEKLVAEAELEIRQEEGSVIETSNSMTNYKQQTQLSASAESSSWTFRHDSKEYFGKLRKQVNEKVKKKSSFDESVKPFPRLTKMVKEEKEEQANRKQKQQALFYSLDVGSSKQEVPSSVDSIEEINSQNDHNNSDFIANVRSNDQEQQQQQLPFPPNRHSLPPIPPPHSPPNQQSNATIQEPKPALNDDHNAPSPFRNLLHNRMRSESVEKLHQINRAGNSEAKEQRQNHDNELY